MTEEQVRRVARAIVSQCKANGASDGDIGAIVGFALLDHLDFCVLEGCGNPNAVIDATVMALQLRRID